MKRVARPLLLGVVLVLGFPLGVMGQKPVAAIVEKISGTVLLKHNGKQISLNAKTDIARRLFADDSVHCESGSKLILRVGGKPTELNDKSGWYVIPVPSARTDPRQKAIDEYGRIGGRSRGGPLPTSIVYSPSDESFATPNSFVIRWTALKNGCSISFAISDDDGKKLWEQTNVDGALGMLSSDAARKALSNYQAKSDLRKLTLKLTSSCEDSDESTFFLLSVADEQRMKAELAQWNNEHDQLFAHLGRAFVFFQAKMLAQVAEEYEAALEMAPDSRDLIESTSAAERLTGNMRRARELEKRLPTEPTVP